MVPTATQSPGIVCSTREISLSSRFDVLLSHAHVNTIHPPVLSVGARWLYVQLCPDRFERRFHWPFQYGTPSDVVESTRHVFTDDEREVLRQRQETLDENDARDAALSGDQEGEAETALHIWLEEMANDQADMLPPAERIPEPSAALPGSSGRPIDLSDDEDNESLVSASVVNSSISDITYVPHMN